MVRQYLNPYSSQFAQALLFEPESLVEPYAWAGHMPFAYWLVSLYKPKVFVELGTHSGNSYFAFCQSIKENKLETKAFAIDTWQGDQHAGYYGDDIFDNVVKENQKYKAFSELIRSTFDQASTEFQDSSIDLLHIDGLHTYEAVLHDFKTWLPKVAPGGFILFHDIQVRTGDFGVFKLWEELSKKYETLEFSHSHGLGVLRTPGGDNSILSFEPKDRDLLRELFEGLGSNIFRICENHQLKGTITHLESDRQAILQTCSALTSSNRELLASKSWRYTRFLRRFQKWISTFRSLKQ